MIANSSAHIAHFENMFDVRYGTPLRISNWQLLTCLAHYPLSHPSLSYLPDDIRAINLALYHLSPTIIQSFFYFSDGTHAINLALESNAFLPHSIERSTRYSTLWSQDVILQGSISIILYHSINR